VAENAHSISTHATICFSFIGRIIPSFGTARREQVAAETQAKDKRPQWRAVLANETAKG